MEDVETDVRQWDRMMLSQPTFEELRDVEFVRQSGAINMITDNLVGELRRRGRHAGADWVMRCKANRTSWVQLYSPAISFYTKSHGPPAGWFPKELLTEWESEEIADELIRLRARVEALQRRANSREK